MKVILSRKGFDSQYGRMPSPILPDGTLLSLPIPSKTDVETAFTDLTHDGKSYYEIIKGLNPNTKIKESYFCHLDPDIRRTAKHRDPEWRPAFGQESAALTHLKNKGVGIGDLFLFFGWFRQTEYVNGQLSYKRNAPDLHVIYGYFQIGEILDHSEGLPQWLLEHPHVKPERWKRQNVIYLSSPKLDLHPDLPGADCLQFSNKLVLTKEGHKRSVWNLPDFFRQIEISYNPDPWKDDCFVSAAKGQEFVFEANDNVNKWIYDIIH